MEPEIRIFEQSDELLRFFSDMLYEIFHKRETMSGKSRYPLDLSDRTINKGFCFVINTGFFQEEITMSHLILKIKPLYKVCEV